LILALTAGEEAASDYAAGMVADKPSRSVNAKLCLNADAGGPQIRHGKYLAYSSGGEKISRVSARSERRRRPRSLPTPDNPIYRLGRG